MTPRKGTKGTYKAVSAFVLCILCFFVADAVAQDELAARQGRGRQIYREGTSRSGTQVLAYIGESSLEVPGSTIPCAGCHGIDGRGKPEGGINPSNVTWDFLTKPYGLKHVSGRQHPPYTERGLELAITRGIDPGGNKLLQAMPRYVMSREDLADLVAYLQVLGNDSVPGVSDNRIVIGTLVPDSGVLTELGRAAAATTKAVFDEVNSQGGIYGRRLELQVIQTADTPAATRARVEPKLNEQGVFAMSAAVVAGAEKEILPLFSRTETPLIGPFTLYPETGFPLNRQVFYLVSGVEDQARSLLNFIAQKPEFKNSNLAVINARSEFNAAAVEAIKAHRKKKGLSEPLVIDNVAGGFDGAELVRRARQASAGIVFFLGSRDDVFEFMREAERLDWFPALLTPGALGPQALAAPAGFDGKVFISFPIAPEDQTGAGMKEFRTLAAKYNLPATHLPAQISAYAAAKILIEAIRRVGKDVTREGLLQALEGFHQYATELTPAITYGPNRRLGATGAHVITIDLKAKKLVSAGGWIDSN